MNNLSARIDGLESRIAEQDRVIEDLNAIVTAQRGLLEALRRDLARIADRLGDAETRFPAEPERPPPHY